MFVTPYGNHSIQSIIMTNTFKIFLCGIFLFCLSCESGISDLDKILEDPKPNPGVESRSGNSNQANTPIYSNSELIVLFDSSLTPAQKNALRIFHGVLNYEVCQLCPDESIEKWFFGGPINIEPKRQAIESSGGVVDVDYEFDFTTIMGDISPGSIDDTSYEDFIVSSNSGVTIAVLDTGFDPFFPFCYMDDGVTPFPIMYNADDTEVYDETSGWNFVDYHHNAFDDHNGKHGTAVSRCISQPLQNDSIPHQILPLKICDEDGVTSYFKFICATRYAFERADIIQMSLGWYDDGFGDFENTIFQLLTDAHRKVIVVCSAGNDTSDNDGEKHYPSSYENNNVIAVASTNSSSSDISDFSNWGATSVDFFAVGELIPFYHYDHTLISPLLEGTSFAAPQIASQVAKYLHSNPDLNATGIKNQLSSDGLVIPELYENKCFYDRYFSILVD